jgi:mycothiol synthase
MTTPTGVFARSCSGVHDLNTIYGMTASLPNVALHLTDLPWRLASPAAQDSAWVRLWEARDGTLLAWAILQFPWHCLDYEVRPGPHREWLEQAVLDWAVERLTGEAASRGEELPFYVSARSSDMVRLAAVHRAGFRPDDWSYLHLSRDLREPVPRTALPDGFQIRPLAGEAEVAAYVATHRAAFGSTNMTADWRRRTIRDPRYVPELDLVAVGSDGTVAAFCVGWMTPPTASLADKRVAQIEPLGVLPAYQRIGLGRALLLEAFHRALTIGASRIEVDAESYNEASLGLYESAGFRMSFEAPFALRVFGQAAICL